MRRQVGREGTGEGIDGWRDGEWKRKEKRKKGERCCDACGGGDAKSVIEGRNIKMVEDNEMRMTRDMAGVVVLVAGVMVLVVGGGFGGGCGDVGDFSSSSFMIPIV
ncbi:hypothetical protein Tco_0493255, partial [Tanacetum coccineum]